MRCISVLFLECTWVMVIVGDALFGLPVSVVWTGLLVRNVV